MGKYLFSKFPRQSFTKATSFLDLVHNDVCGLE
jgi:hypothetical protein